MIFTKVFSQNLSYIPVLGTVRVFLKIKPIRTEYTMVLITTEKIITIHFYLELF